MPVTLESMTFDIYFFFLELLDLNFDGFTFRYKIILTSVAVVPNGAVCCFSRKLLFCETITWNLNEHTMQKCHSSLIFFYLDFLSQALTFHRTLAISCVYVSNNQILVAWKYQCKCTYNVIQKFETLLPVNYKNAPDIFLVGNRILVFTSAR